MKLCIVGGGLTGAIAAAAIKRAIPQVQIEIWDKAKQIGGRMCTKRTPNEPRKCSVDVGAQYISNTPEYAAKHQPEYESLLSAGVLRPLKCAVSDDRHPAQTQHYFAPQGMSSVVKYYATKSQSSIRCGARVTHIKTAASDTASRQWRVSAAESGEEGVFDALLLTLPVPQMLALQGDVSAAIDDAEGLRSNLESVGYSSRYCLGLFYDPEESKTVTLPRGVGAAYITGKHPFCFVAIDTIKRDLDPSENGGVSVILHTTRQYGEEHIEDSMEHQHQALLQHLHTLMPHWPGKPAASICHKWRYSQVTQSMPQDCGGSVQLSDGSVVLSGDAFTHSNMDGCIEAANSAAKRIISYLSTL